MKNKINAKIIADSISPQGSRITSSILTYPRFIHAELMTHRMFSRNSASSRAIPFKKMVKMVEEDLFIPIAWQKDHKGMQGTEYLTSNEIELAIEKWKAAAHNAVNSARMLNNNYFGVQKPLVTKQICNRLLEPFMWHTVLVTATEWDNFFELRCSKYRFGKKIYHSKTDWYNDPDLNSPDGFIGDSFPHEDPYWWYSINESGAEIHIQALAEAMWDAMNESTPKQLKAGEWHIPFGDKINSEDIASAIGFKTTDYDWYNKEIWSKIKISSARCARLSYMTFDGEIDYEKDIKLHDQLLASKHMSPFEHVARCMNEYEFHNFTRGFPSKNGIGSFIQTGWCNNFRGFIPYRYLIENQLK